MTPRSTFTVLLFATLSSSLSTLQAGFTTAATPSDGVYRFTFGVNETGDGSFAVPASAAYDVRGTYDAADAFTYGFLGTRDGSYADDVPASDDHYIVYTPSESGTLALKFSANAYVKGRSPTLIIKAADSASECADSSGDAKVSVSAANTEYVLSANLERGVTYYIWTYSYNWGGGGFYHNYTIPAITYTCAPTAKGHNGILFRAR